MDNGQISNYSVCDSETIHQLTQSVGEPHTTPQEVPINLLPSIETSTSGDFNELAQSKPEASNTGAVTENHIQRTEPTQIHNSESSQPTTQSLSTTDCFLATASPESDAQESLLSRPEPETSASVPANQLILNTGNTEPTTEPTEAHNSEPSQPTSAPEALSSIDSFSSSSSSSEPQLEHPAVERTFACISKALTTRALDIKQRLLPL